LGQYAAVVRRGSIKADGKGGKTTPAGKKAPTCGGEEKGKRNLETGKKKRFTQKGGAGCPSESSKVFAGGKKRHVSNPGWDANGYQTHCKE